MTMDVERVTALLTVVKDVSTVAPGFTHISSEAMAELREINQAISDAKAKEQGRVPAPAPVGDEDSPTPPIPSGLENSPQLDLHPTASTPTRAPIPGPKPNESPKLDRKI